MNTRESDSHTQAPSKSLSVYAEELRQWLALTRQYQVSNQMYQLALMTTCLSSISTPNLNSGSSSTDTSTSNITESADRAAGRPELPRTFPISAGRSYGLLRAIYVLNLQDLHHWFMCILEV